MNRNYGLDVLRATAILLVLASHTTFFVIQAIPQSEFIKLTSYFCGFWGVELFFVLSGFLIGKIIRNLAVSDSSHWLVSFWIRRWFRTIPCYLLFLILNILWYFYLNGVLPESLLSYLIFAQNLAWEHPVFFPEAWSLSIEEYFYLLFPIMIWALIKARLKPETAYLASGAFLLLFSTVLRLISAALEPSLPWDAGVRKVVIFRLDSLIYGIYLSFFIDLIRIRKWQNLLLIIGLIALSISMLAYFNLSHDHSYFLKTLQFSLTSAGFTLVTPYMLDLSIAERSILGGFFRKTALWSYSMYLCNFLIYNMIQTLIFSSYFADRPGEGALPCIALMLVLTYLVSALVYASYEFPMMNLRESAIARLQPFITIPRETTP